jgi:hypothetical protein
MTKPRPRSCLHHPLNCPSPPTPPPRSLICDDLHRLGYRRVVMDPTARTAYDMPTAWLLHAGAFDLQAVAGLGATPWSAVEARAQALGLVPPPAPPPAAAAAPVAPAPLPSPARGGATALAVAPAAAALGRRGGFAAALAAAPLPAPAAASPGPRAPSPLPLPLPRAAPPASPFAARGVPIINWDAPAALPAYSEIDCCHKGEDDEHVYFEFCRPGDVLHRNYTRRFFEECRLVGQHEEPEALYFPEDAPPPVDPVAVLAAKLQAAAEAEAAKAEAEAAAARAAAAGSAGGGGNATAAAATAAAGEGGGEAEKGGEKDAKEEAKGDEEEGGEAGGEAGAPAAAGMPEVLSDPGGPRFNRTYYTARARHPDGTWDWAGIASQRAACPP